MLHVSLGSDIFLSISLKLSSSGLISSTLKLLHGTVSLLILIMSFGILISGLLVSILVVLNLVLSGALVSAHATSLALFHVFSPVSWRPSTSALLWNGLSCWGWWFWRSWLALLFLHLLGSF